MSTRSSIVWYSISGLTCSQLAPVNFYGLAGSISCSNIGPFNHQMSRKKSKCFWDIWHIRFLGGGDQSYYYNFGGFRGHQEWASRVRGGAGEDEFRPTLVFLIWSPTANWQCIFLWRPPFQDCYLKYSIIHVNVITSSKHINKMLGDCGMSPKITVVKLQNVTHFSKPRYWFGK